MGVQIIRNKILKQNQCFSDHKLLTLSNSYSQMNVTGIYLSPEQNVPV